MKKIIIVVSIIICILVINKENNDIPKESIRFRIVANSNNSKDQILKREILNNLKSSLKVPNNISNINEARDYYQKQLPTFNKIVEKTLVDNNDNRKYSINYGLNYFPEKKYQNKKYASGEYESLVITIGDGLGKNFWCVLFPPLCLVDKDNKNYSSVIKEIMDKYF